MAEKTTGRGRKGTKKAVKQPIPIDTGITQSQTTATQVSPDNTPATQAYPGTSTPSRATPARAGDPGTSTPSRATPARAGDPGIEDEIRRRAYELYEERGRQDGFQEEDWARAETEILSRHQREKSA